MSAELKLDFSLLQNRALTYLSVEVVRDMRLHLLEQLKSNAPSKHGRKDYLGSHPAVLQNEHVPSLDMSPPRVDIVAFDTEAFGKPWKFSK